MKSTGVRAIVYVTFVFSLVTLLPARIAYSCAFEDLASVHFNTYRPDFGTPARRAPRGYWDGGLWDASDGYELPKSMSRYPDRRYVASDSARLATLYEAYDQDELLKLKIDALYLKAGKRAKAGMWSEARQVYLKIIDARHRWTGDLRDLIDLMTALASRRRVTNAEQKAVELYVSATEKEREGKWPIAKTLLRRLNDAAGATFLKDRVSYQSACIAYEFHQSDEAINLYKVCADNYPHSPKREESLIMIARICILQDARDQRTLETGQAAIRELLAQYPHTRFYNSAFGLRARVHFLKHRYNDALWCYYCLGDLESVLLVCNAMPHALDGPSLLQLLEAYLIRIHDDRRRDIDREILAVQKVNRLRNQLSLAMIQRFRDDLKNSPSLLVSYVYYRLYYTNTRSQDLASLADLARTVISRSPRTAISPAVEVRLAEVEYQQHHYTQCIEWASRALRDHNGYDRALFIQASAEEKQKRFAAAHTDLIGALKFSTESALRLSVRQLLALVCEQQRDFAGALDQYYALGYDLDAAYLLDVRMSPKQIEAYWHNCNDALPSSSIWRLRSPSKPITVTFTRRQQLAYTLGVHYLRLEKWGSANKWFSMLSKSLRRTFDTGRREYGSNPSPDALTAVRDLSLLQTRIKQARGYESKAAAAYRYASYYHNNGALLLYNAMLWHGGRVGCFEEGWNTRCQTRADLDALERYLASHEVYLRSRKLCLDVARQYPHSRVAPKALYRAACASERMGALAGWYEGQNKGFLFAPAGEAAMLMRSLVSLYPHSPLVASATKYAGVFAANSRPAEWPKYAVASHTNGPRPNDSQIANNAEITDAEALLASTP